MRLPLSGSQRLDLLGHGARLLDAGRFFDAHEAFEDLWHSSAAPDERDLWQGMAQLCGALVKHGRGDRATALSLLGKSRKRLAGGPIPVGSPSSLGRLLEEIEQTVRSRAILTGLPMDPCLVEALRAVLQSGR